MKHFKGVTGNVICTNLQEALQELKQGHLHEPFSNVVLTHCTNLDIYLLSLKLCGMYLKVCIVFFKIVGNVFKSIHNVML